MTSGSDHSFLRVDGVSKRYGAVTAIDDVSLSIPQGEFLTLLGPSGSGKTTLLMAIAGFVTPSAGRILLEGSDLVHLPPEKRNLGVVFQGYALFPHMSVAENVAFPLQVRRTPKAEIADRVRAALDMVHLSGLADRKPAQLSGGQQQRVALARALVFSPPVVLLDEPLSALDKQLRGQLQEELKSLHRRLGVTFVNVTHDQDEALSMSTSVAVINHGRLVQLGPPREVYERPRSVFVAQFVGRSNMIDAEVLGHDGGLTRVRAGDRVIAAAGVTEAAGGVVLSIRPERLAFLSDGEDAANTLSGQVEEFTYHGNSTHVLVSTPLGIMRVEAPAWRLGGTLTQGQTVTLGWPADASILVPRDVAA